MFITPNGDCHPCCVRDPLAAPLASLKTDSLESAWNSPAMKALRLDLLAGRKREDLCKHCYRSEEQGMSSHRNLFNRKFAHLIDKKVMQMRSDGHLPDHQWAYWDFRLSNTCNFKCRSCGPEFSTAWQAELSAKDSVPRAQYNSVWRDGFEFLIKNSHELEEVYFAGGEPLLIEEHYKMLLWLLENKTNVHLRYNTNLSVLTYKKWDVLELWRQFKSVSVSPSLDHHGMKAEFIRKGTDWTSLANNLQLLLKEKNIHVHPTLTLGIFNICDFAEIHSLFMQTGVIKEVNAFAANILYSPAHYHMGTLPEPLKQKAAQDLIHYDNLLYKKYGKRLSCLSLLLNELKRDYQFHFDDFIKTSLHLDQRRNENFFSVFPEFKPFYNA